MTGQRLPQAYRSRPRPSSALSAKASTVCPCSLDQKNTGKNRCRYGVFKVRARYKRARPNTKDAAFAFTGRAGLSKLSSVRESNVEVDVILGELNSRTEINFHRRVQRLPE